VTHFKLSRDVLDNVYQNTYPNKTPVVRARPAWVGGMRVRVPLACCCCECGLYAGHVQRPFPWFTPPVSSVAGHVPSLPRAAVLKIRALHAQGQ
jgi:hypothetical protein